MKYVLKHGREKNKVGFCCGLKIKKFGFCGRIVCHHEAHDADVYYKHLLIILCSPASYRGPAAGLSLNLICTTRILHFCYVSRLRFVHDG